jgi:FkbM family methyltransferase
MTQLDKNQHFIKVPVHVDATEYSIPTQWRSLGAANKAQHVVDLSAGRGIKPVIVLEVGAGDGAILKKLSDLGFGEQLHALEISASGVEIIRKQNIPRLKSCTVFNGYELPFEDHSVDLVILSHVIEHVEYERVLLREIHRVSRYQVMEIPLDFHNLSPAFHFLGPSYGHINAHSPASFRFLLATEGFSLLGDSLGRGSYELKEYDFFENHGNPRTDSSLAQFKRDYQNDHSQYLGKSGTEKENSSEYYAVLTQADSPAEIRNRAMHVLKGYLDGRQTHLAKMIFEKYVGKENGRSEAQVLMEHAQKLGIASAVEYFSSIATQSQNIYIGNDYGGWLVNPVGLGNESVVYSFGVGEDISFDLGLMTQFGTNIYAFDPTPKSIEWIKKQNLPQKFHFFPLGLMDYDGMAQFKLPANPNHVSCSVFDSSHLSDQVVEVDVRRLFTLMNQLGHRQVDLLKMDIEGSEYGVIADLVHSKVRPAQIMIEFHHRFESIGNQKTIDAINMLRNVGYDLFYEKNNYQEVSFSFKGSTP